MTVLPGPAPILLDGGLGTELAADDPLLWSARVLLDDPHRVLEAHRAFFAAGARVAVTASYQISTSGFAAAGLDAATADRALRDSVALARVARDEIAHDGVERWVAASLGPYGASLADGSEYRGDDALTQGELEAWHRPRILALASACPDLVAVETIPSVREVRAVTAALRGAGVPAWVCVSTRDGLTGAGDPLDEAFAAADASDDVVALGVNCCAPEDVLGAIRIARRTTAKPIVVYPNSGEEWDAATRRWTGSASFDPSLVAAWREAGADVIGGCCRVGPAAIAALRHVLAREAS